MKAITTVGSLCVTAMISLFGCGHDDRDTMTPASRPAPADNERSVSALAAARCDREAHCNNVGQKGDYTSRKDCITRMERDYRDDLNGRECPGGIDRNRLEGCLTQIREEECGHPLDHLERVAECRSGALCLN